MAVEIKLSQGLSAFIDEQDSSLICPFKWYASKGGHTFYALRAEGGRSISMHQVIIGLSSSEIDHEDGNGLNNRRSNLRLCTHAENMRNQRKQEGTTSRFKGVRIRGAAWVAEIMHDGDHIHLGSFSDEISAALQYDRAARLMFGKFARTNASLGLIDGHVSSADGRSRWAKDRDWRNEMRRVGINTRVA